MISLRFFRRCIVFVLAVMPVICCAQEPIRLYRWNFSDLYPLSTRISRQSRAYGFSVGDGPVQPVGLLGREIAPYLRAHPGAGALFSDYQRRTRNTRTVSQITMVASTVGFIAFVVGIADEPDHDGLIYTGLGLQTMAVISTIFVRSSEKRSLGMFEDAVRIYNRSLD